MYERVTLSVNSAIQKGKGLGLGEEPPLIKLCWDAPLFTNIKLKKKEIKIGDHRIDNKRKQHNERVKTEKMHHFVTRNR